MPNLYPCIRPLLWRLPTETAHRAALRALEAGLGGLATRRSTRRDDPPALAQTLWGLDFRNPFGIAAGFDKDARVPDALLAAGFGSVEIGTVTPRPQPGNPAPRVFRLEADDGIINRMGFPSAGLDAVLARLARSSGVRRGVLGINVGKNKDTAEAGDDYEIGVRRAAPYADYLVANVSSPNTPGLRDLQRRAPLETLLRRLVAARDAAPANRHGRRPPLLVKVAPDLDAAECADIAAVALATGIDGIVLANTTVARRPELTSADVHEPGGFSGPALFAESTRILAEFRRLTRGEIPLIGVGGVFTAENAYAKIRAGASLVQIHTALIYRGIDLVGDLKQGLAALLRRDGFASVAEAVGTDVSGAAAGGAAAPPRKAFAAE